MKRIVTLSLTALLAAHVPAPGASDPQAPVVVSGMVGSEAARAALLARLRAVYGARVLDQLEVGAVATPANWDSQVAQLITPQLARISAGQLAIDGNAVSLRGNVDSEALRQQIGAAMRAGLNPTYTVSTDLRVSRQEQAALDGALAGRIIEFESGHATLTASGCAILDQMAAALARMPGKRVAVIGHTDGMGARARNLALSQARAEAVRRYLATKGIDPGQVAVAGMGPDRPVADNRSVQGRARNRRIEFKVL